MVEVGSNGLSWNIKMLGPGIWTVKALLRLLQHEYELVFSTNIVPQQGYHPLLNTIRVGAAGILKLFNIWVDVNQAWLKI